MPDDLAADPRRTDGPRLSGASLGAAAGDARQATGLVAGSALEHPTVGRVIRAMAAQLRQQHAKALEVERKAARFGRKVEWTGYGHKPIKPPKI